MLGPKDFGLIGLSMVFISVFSYFISTGLFAALIQRSEVSESHLSSVFYFNITVAIILFILFYFSAPELTFFLGAESDLTLVIRSLTFVFLISAFTQVQESILRRNLQFNILAKSVLIATAISGCIAVVMAWLGFGIWSLILQTLVDRVVQSFYFWKKSNWRPKLIFEIKAIKELWAYGINSFFIGFIENIVSQIDSIMVSKQFGVTELGLFSRSKSLNGFAFRYSSESIGSVMFPTLSRNQSDKNEFVKLGIKTEVLVSFVSTGLLGWLFVNSENIILIVLGSKWHEAIGIFELLLLSGFAYPMNAATNIMLRASRFSRPLLKLELTKNLFYLCAIFIGFNFGMQGFLVSLIFSGVFNIVANIYVTNIYFGTTFFFHIRTFVVQYLIGAFSALTTILFCHKISSNFNSLLWSTFLFWLFFLVINMVLKTTAFSYFKLMCSRFFSRLPKTR